jgi:translocation and assembly module TamB
VAVVVVTAGIVWVAGTDSGARWGFERLGAILPGELQIAELEGPMRSPLRIRDLTYRTEDVEITVQRLALRWQLGKLWTRRLDIAELVADSVRVVLARRPGTIRESGDSAAVPLPDLDMPVHILLRDTRLRHVEISRQAEPGRFVADEIHLESLAFRDTLGLKRATLRSAELDLDIEGTVLPRRDYPLLLQSRWTWRRPGLPLLAGSGRAVGTIESLVVDQRLTAPSAARFQGVITTIRRRPAVDGVLEFDRLDPSTLVRGWPAQAASGTVHLRGRQDRFTLEGSAQTEAGATPLDTRFLIEREPDRWRIERMAVNVPGRDGSAQIRGTVFDADTAGTRPTRLDLRADWRDVEWPLRSARGTLHARGTLDAFALRGEADLQPADLPRGRWQFRGSGTPRGVHFTAFSGHWLGGQARGNGRIDWSPALAWDLDFTGRDIDPATVWPSWPGSLALRARYSGHQAGSRTVTNLAFADVKGTVRGYPAEGFARLEFGGAENHIDSLEVRVGTARAAAAGVYGARWDMGWQMDVPDLGVLVENGAGSFSGSGRIEGPGGATRLAGIVTGDSLTDGRSRVQHVAARFDVATSGRGPVGGELEASELWLGQRRLTSVDLNLDGRSDDHRISATLKGVSDSLQVVANGGFGGQAWRGMLETLQLDSRGAGTWTLERPAPLMASTREVAVEDFCWRSGNGHMCGAGAWHAGRGWNVDATLDSVSLATLEPWLPGDLELTGPLEGRVVARADATGRLTGSATLRAGPGEMSYPVKGGDRITTPIELSTLDVDAAAGGVDARGRLALTRVGTVEGEVGLPGFRFGAGGARTQPMNGTLQVRIDDLSPVQAFTPEVDDTRGRLQADLDLGGTLQRPALTGTARLTGGEADISRLEIRVTDVTLEARSTGPRQMTVNGRMHSGRGSLELTGDVVPAQGGGSQARLDVRGQRFEAMDTDQMTLVITPDIHVRATVDRVDVTGSLEVPEGRFVSYGDQDPLVRPSPDVIESHPDSDTLRKLPVHSRVRLTLGQNFTIRAHAFEGRPTGSILLVDEPQTSPRAYGELRVLDGFYRAYGQDLRIEHGRLIFAGSPLVNPALDIRAARAALDGTVAGFEAHGSLRSPQVELWSFPPMSQDEIASYVLTGRPLREASGDEERLIGEFAQAVVLRRGNILGSHVADALGVDEVRIEADGGDVDETAVLIGTYPLPRLHIMYGIGIVEPVGTVRVRYMINSKWMLEAETERESKADLLYTIER